VHVSADADQVRLDVTDTGDGFAPGEADRLFERFYRADTSRSRDNAGSGIGLTIARAIVTAHHGSLRAHSHGPGRGAVFTIRLPRSPKTIPGALDRGTG
jgi:signal transduction histidine kinase